MGWPISWSAHLFLLFLQVETTHYNNSIMKRLVKTLLVAGTALLPLSGCDLNAPIAKPRLVVMTDIGPGEVEPDDMESAVRLMAYADMYEIEAICTTIGWNCDPYPEEWARYLDTVVTAYEHDVSNLMKRSRQTEFQPIEEENKVQKIGYWPSAEYIRSRCVMGSKRAGIGVIGEGNDSPGSDLLIKLALEDDPRPIWVTSWGGSNTLAQAIWRYKQTATPEELRKFVQKFRIYTITDQDMQYSMRMNRAFSSHQWMRQEFKDDLLFIWDESAWLNQCENGKQNWDKYAAQIQGKGELGKAYPKYLWGVEGDTPSFLHVMPNGLGNPNIPAQVTWGGYHVMAMCPDSLTYAYTNWQQPVKDISNGYEMRFYPDEFNDFAARMQWAAEGKGNHNPVIEVNEASSSEAKGLVLDASKSRDIDGDSISFRWWIQPEAGTVDTSKIVLMGTETDHLTIRCADTTQLGKTLHIICEGHDNGPFSLVAYKRLQIDLN